MHLLVIVNQTTIYYKMLLLINILYTKKAAPFPKQPFTKYKTNTNYLLPFS